MIVNHCHSTGNHYFSVVFFFKARIRLHKSKAFEVNVSNMETIESMT